MGITRTVMVDDDGSGTTGTILNNAWLQTIYNQIDGLVGAWADVPFSAPGYVVGAGGGTWTVIAANQLTYCVTLLNTNTVLVAFYLANTVIAGGSPTSLKIALPGSVPTPIRTLAAAMPYWGPANSGVGVALIDPGQPWIRLQKNIAGTPFAADANFYVKAELFISY